MKNTDILLNSNGEVFFRKETEGGVIYSFSENFEDYWTDSEQECELSRVLSLAHSYYSQEHEKHGMQFDHCVCIEDIHEMFGEEIAIEVNNSIANDIPELGIRLIK